MFIRVYSWYIKTMKLFKAMATVAGLTALSRVFGFIRDIITAALMGAGPVADAFFVALKLPNLFRRITAEGAFSVSFIPLYSDKLEKEGGESADAFASRALSVMLLFLIPFTLLCLLAMPWIIYVIAPGFQGDALRYDMAVEMSRISFPYLLMMSVTSLMGGIMNATGRFAAFAAAPVFFNLSMIFGLIFFTPILDTAGHGLAAGIFLAGVVQMVWLYYCLRRVKIRLTLPRPAFDADIKKLFKLMGPGALGAGVVHVNLFADMVIASLLPAGAISYLYYADRLNQLPLGMVGVAVGTALLPMLSRALSAGDHKESVNYFNRALEVCFLFSIPASAAFLCMADEIIRGLFERGEFTPADTVKTAHVLMAYAIGMPAYVGAKVLSSVFWSHQDTVTPVKISILVTVLNIALSLALIPFIGVAGIALATGLVGWVQFLLMKRAIKKYNGFEYDARFRKTFAAIILSAGAMAAVILTLSHLLQGVGRPEVLMLLLVSVGAGVYGGGILMSGAIKISDLKHYLSRKKKA